MNLLWSDALDRGQLADRIHLIADADLDPRLRNALLVDVYCDLSEDVAGVIYGLDVPADHIRPNFYTYAIWGAHTVGIQLRRRFVPGAARRARALESGNAAIIAEIGDAAYWFRREMRPSTSWEWAPRGPTPPAPDTGRSTHDRPPPAADGPPGHPTGGERDGDERSATDHHARRRPPIGGRPRAASFLTEASCGLPTELLEAAGCTGDETVAGAIDRFRARGLECYRSATAMRIDHERGRVHNLLDDDRRRIRDALVLEGNAWLAMAEQSLIEDQIAVAARVNVRRWTTSPWHRLTMSQRDWRSREVSGPALRLEHWFGRMATRRLLTFEHPGGAIASQHARPGHGLPIARWYRDERARHHRTWQDLGPPFGLIDLVESVEWWPGIRERLAAIFLLMATTHDARWFARADRDRVDMPSFANLHRPSPWPGIDDATRALSERLRSPRGHQGGDRAWWRERVECSGSAPRAVAGTSPPFACDHDWSRAVAGYAAHRTSMFLALFVRSLPASFLSPSGAAVLDPASVGIEIAVSPRAESMLGDSFRRLGGTADLLDRFFSPDAEVRADALAIVRGMHDGWRARVNGLFEGASTRPRVLCDPIGDEQILGTACTFVTPVHELFTEFRVPSPEPDWWDAWARVWCDIAVAQGADPAYVRDRVTASDGSVTLASMAQAAAAIEATHRDRTEGGVRLMANLVRDVRDGLPHWSRNSFLGALAVFGEPAVLDLLLVPPRPERRWGRAVTLAAVATPGLRRVFWWWVDRSISRVRELVAEADRGRPLADLDRVFPGYTAGVTRVPLPD